MKSNLFSLWLILVESYEFTPHGNIKLLFFYFSQLLSCVYVYISIFNQPEVNPHFRLYIDNLLVSVW